MMNSGENILLLRPNQGQIPHWKDRAQWLLDVCPPISLSAKSIYFAVLLILVSLGYIAGALSWNPTAIFMLNFLTIIPLSVLLTSVVEELSARLQQPWKGLLIALFTNPVKLILNIVAVNHNEIRVAQSCMLGSILSNILFLLGCCFLAAGIRSQESHFNTTTASTMSSLMVVASISLIIPTSLDNALCNSKSGSRDRVVILSHGIAIVSLLLYLLYLYFRLISHANLFDDERVEEDEELRQSDQRSSLTVSCFSLVTVIVLVVIASHFLISSIDALAKKAHISKTFIGLILLPILGNGKERVTAVRVAASGKMDLGIDVAIGSSMQIALFVTPLLVILSWIIRTPDPMTLNFQVFETIVFFVSILVVDSLLRDGKSNFLEGAMCLGSYIIIALAFRLYLDDRGD